MRAARIYGYGDTSVIRIDDVPVPAPGPGEVLIRVAATSFNPSEIGLRRGLLRAVFALDLPYTLGVDVAGTVVAVGPEVRGHAVGDRVVGRVDSGGTAAEYVVADAGTVVPAPYAVPLSHAAALPVAGVTAWQAVYDHARIRPGQRVLVNGAGGGVGGFTVQLARRAGGYVVATASPRSAAVVRGLGADEVVDYTASSLGEAVVEPVDVLLNLVPVGVKRTAELLALVDRDGSAVWVTSVPRPTAGTARSGPDGGLAVTPVHFVARNDPEQLAALVKLVDAGELRLDITASRPLDELAEVHREAEAGRMRGKTILVPAG